MDTKICNTCENELPIAQFAFNKAKSDGFQDKCRECKKAYNASYYARTKHIHNPARAIHRNLRMARIQGQIFQYLQDHPCVDCGENDIVVLDFDHLGGKEFNVSEMVRRSASWSKILLEIGKCEVVCANDHRRRTATRGNWARLKAQQVRVVSSDGRALDS